MMYLCRQIGQYVVIVLFGTYFPVYHQLTHLGLLVRLALFPSLQRVLHTSQVFMLLLALLKEGADERLVLDYHL